MAVLEATLFRNEDGSIRTVPVRPFNFRLSRVNCSS
jgi:hypothetical protein